MKYSTNIGHNDRAITLGVDYDMTPGTPDSWYEPGDAPEVTINGIEVVKVALLSGREVSPRASSAARLVRAIEKDDTRMELIEAYVCEHGSPDEYEPEPDYDRENYFDRARRELEPWND